jgi:CRISPR-associated protein Csx17
LAELKRLLAEGRAQLGPRQAVEPLDFARAIARLGTARGVSAFQRFGYIERNGQSNLAVPLGRFVVPDRSSRKLACLDDLELWLWRLRRRTRTTQAAHRLAQAERRLTDALLAIAQHPDQPTHWKRGLLCLADIEAIQNAGSGYEAGPIPPLDPEWVRAAHDGDDVELRLALAFALQTEELSGAERDACASVRRYWVSLEGGRFATTGTAPLIRLARRPDRVMQARRGVDDASALIARSLLEASRRGIRKWVLKPTRDAAVSAADLALVLTGAVDLDRTLRLARALMAIDLRKWAQRPVVLPPSVGPEMPDDAWLAIRLTLLPYCLWPGQRIAADPAILRRLESGDASAAIDLALARLRVYGMQPVIRMGTVSADAARLWAAALAFPITFQTARVFARRLDSNFAREDVA